MRCFTTLVLCRALPAMLHFPCMSKVSVAWGDSSYEGVKEVLDACGMDLVEAVKNAKNIVVAGEGDAVRAVVDFVRFHCRTSITVLSDDARDIVEGSMPRGDDVRMPIRRPRIAMEADFCIAVAPMIPDRALRNRLSIEHWVFSTWFVPARSGSVDALHRHEPWLEGELRDDVLADVYAQKPVTFAIVDGSATVGMVFASFDAIAVDSVVRHVVDLDSEDGSYLSRLAAQGMGENRLSRIDVPMGVIVR